MGHACIKVALSPILLLAASMSFGQAAPLVISYSPMPKAGQPFQVNVTTGPCDSIDDGFLGTPTFELVGGVLRLTTIGFVNNSLPCNYIARTATFNAPAIPAGNYTLEIYYRFAAIEPPQVTLRQTALLGVGPGAPGAPVPVLGFRFTVLLAMGMGIVALAVLAPRAR